VIYQETPSGASLTQGDILDGCPVFRGPPRNLMDCWVSPTQASPLMGWMADVAEVRVVVLTQACDLAHGKVDLAQGKASGVLVAVVHEAHRLNLANAKRKEVQKLRKFGWYFLPAGQKIQESIVDLRDLHTLPLATLEELTRQNKRVCRLVGERRYQLLEQFSRTYSRIAIPDEE